MGQKGQKLMPEVADGHHGGLGRVQEGENGLDVGRLFKILTSVGLIFDFLLFYCYNKTTSKLF